MSRIISALALACALAFSFSADARPKHHKHKHHRHAAVTRVVQVAHVATPTYYADERFTHHDRVRPTPVTRTVRTVARRSTRVVTTAWHTGAHWVDVAKSHAGATARQLGLPRSLWCADFVNKVERENGRRGTGSRLARSFAHYGTPIGGPRVGAIAVLGRRGGGHVGYVSGVDHYGNPIIVSGNHNGAVREAVYPRERVLAYRWPT